MQGRRFSAPFTMLAERTVDMSTVDARDHEAIATRSAKIVAGRIVSSASLAIHLDVPSDMLLISRLTLALRIINRGRGPSFETAAYPRLTRVCGLLRMRSNLLKQNYLMLRSERRERLEAWATRDS